MGSVNMFTNCKSAKDVARTAAEKLVNDGLASIKNGPMNTSAAYKEEIEKFVSIILDHFCMTLKIFITLNIEKIIRD